MGTVLAVAAVMIAAAAVGLLIWTLRARTAMKPMRSDRRISLWALAEVKGLMFDDPQAASLLGMLGFRLLADIGPHGEAQMPTHGADNPISGDWNGTKVITADWWAQELSTSAKAGAVGVAIGAPRMVAEFRTVVWLDAGTFPHAVIRRSGAMREGAERLLGARVDFELEEFNRAFAVEADDRKVAYDVIDARMMRWLLDATTPFDAELGLGGLLLRATRLLDPAEVEPFIETAAAFVEQIPEHARRGLRNGP